MKTIRILFCTLALLTLLAHCALCGQVWTTPQKITASSAWYRGGPVVWGDKVYYTQQTTGDSPTEIWVWDQAGGARLYMGGSDYPIVQAVYQDKVLFTRYSNNQYNLYLHDPVTGDRLISATAGNSANSPSAAMYGDMITWTDVRGGYKQVYTWDPVNGERHLNPTSYDQKNPKIYNGKVVYEDYRYVEDPRYQRQSPDVWSWDVQNGARRLASIAMSPAIYQDDIYVCDSLGRLSRFGPRAATLANGSGVSGPTGVWGDLVVMWTGYSWDPVNGVVKISDDWGSAPTLQGTMAAWTKTDMYGEQGDIYVSTFVPEPSALCSLGMLLAGACVTLRRRRRA